MKLSKKSKSYYLKCLGCFAFMLVFCLLPPIGEITGQGMRILGIYLGTVLLWTFVDLIWPSLLAIFLVSLTGYTSAGAFLSSGFGNQTVIFVLLISIFAHFITESGVSSCIASRIVTLRAAQGRPWAVSALYVLASYVIAMLISSVAATIVVLDFFSQFAKQTGYKKGDRYPTMMMVCITFAAHMGGSVWTFRTPDAILVGYIEAQGGSVPLLPYFLCSLFIGVTALALYLLGCRLFAHADTERITASTRSAQYIPMTKYQKRLLACTFLLLGLLIAEGMLDGSTAVGAFLGRLGTNGIVMLMLAVMMFFRRDNGEKPFADIEEGTRAVPWKIIWLIIFNMPMANILSDDSLGISRTASSAITGLFGAAPNATLFIFIMTVLIVVCTTFIGNVTVCLVFYNVVSLFAPALGVSTTVLACIISLTSNASVILPGANPQAAMLHARTEWVETRDAAKYGVFQSLAVIASVMLAYTLFLTKVLA